MYLDLDGSLRFVQQQLKEEGKDFGKTAKFFDLSKVYRLKKQGLGLRRIGRIVDLSRTRVAQLLLERGVSFKTY